MWVGTVDTLIEALASHIKKGVESERDMTEETKSLAELISARAQCPTFPLDRNQ